MHKEWQDWNRDLTFSRNGLAMTQHLNTRHMWSTPPLAVRKTIRARDPCCAWAAEEHPGGGLDLECIVIPLAQLMSDQCMQPLLHLERKL